MLELSGMQSITSLPSLPGLLWPGMVAADRVISMGEIKLFNISSVFKKRLIELLEIEWFDHLTECKQMIDV